MFVTHVRQTDVFFEAGLEQICVTVKLELANLVAVVAQMDECWQQMCQSDLVSNLGQFCFESCSTVLWI